MATSMKKIKSNSDVNMTRTTMWNFFDCCAISLPLPRDEAARERTI